MISIILNSWIYSEGNQLYMCICSHISVRIYIYMYMMYIWILLTHLCFSSFLILSLSFLYSVQQCTFALVHSMTEFMERERERDSSFSSHVMFEFVLLQGYNYKPHGFNPICHDSFCIVSVCLFPQFLFVIVCILCTQYQFKKYFTEIEKAFHICRFWLDW